MEHDLKKALTTYAADTAARLMQTDFCKLAEIGELLLKTKGEGHTVFLMGNGGRLLCRLRITPRISHGVRTCWASALRRWACRWRSLQAWGLACLR